MNKLIKTTSIIIVMLVLVGVASAAAYNMIITDPPSTEILPGGTYISYIVSLTGIQDTGHSISSTVIKGTTSDLEFQFVTPSGTSSWLASGSSYSWTSTGSSETLTMNVKAIASPSDPIGTVYDFTVEDVQSGVASSKTASASTDTTTIPEFPTIALPIAGMLGLMFIISSRKNKNQ